MMNKEALLELLSKVQEQIQKIDNFTEQVYTLTRLEFLETPLYEGYNNIVDLFFDAITEAIGKDETDKEIIKDTLTWYFYEYLDSLCSDESPSIETAKMWDEDDNPLCYDLNSLCDYLLNL